jgi:hypothetical protein
MSFVNDLFGWHGVPQSMSKMPTDAKQSHELMDYEMPEQSHELMDYEMLNSIMSLWIMRCHEWFVQKLNGLCRKEMI